MRNRLLFIPLVLIAAVLTLALQPRAIQIDQPGLWWNHTARALLEFTADGQLRITHGPCVGMRQQQDQHQVVIQDGALFFPATQTTQAYHTGSLLSGLVDDDRPWLGIDAAGPIPAGRYTYEQFHPIGVCGLEP